MANVRRTGSDSLVTMLTRPCYQPSPSSSDLITDLGWTLERMLEILSLPDVLTSPTEGSGLVNFHKRRWVHPRQMVLRIGLLNLFLAGNYVT